MKLEIDFRFVDELLSALSGSELKVILVLARYRNSDGKAWPSRDTILKKSGLGKDAFYQAVNSLIKKEIIVSRQIKTTSGRFAKVVYSLWVPFVKTYVDISDQPIPDIDTVSGFSVCGSSVSGKDLTEVSNSKELLSSATPPSSTSPSKKSKKEKIDDIYSFAEFWDDYGYKKGRKKAESAYYRLTLKEVRLVKERLQAYLETTVLSDSEQNGEWRPRRALASTYLNSKRFEDEIDTKEKPKDKPVDPIEEEIKERLRVLRRSDPALFKTLFKRFETSGPSPELAKQLANNLTK
jgi:hypothetical protein